MSEFRAAWWWIDRWRKSTAYTDMTVAEQGAYRNLLDELWLRGGTIPDDERILAKISGAGLDWPKVSRAVLERFRKTPDGLRNDTHDEVAEQCRQRRDALSRLGQAGGKARAAAAQRGEGGRFQPKIDQQDQPQDQPRSSSTAGRTAGQTSSRATKPPAPSPEQTPEPDPAQESLSDSATEPAEVRRWIDAWNRVASRHGLPAVRNLNPAEQASLRLMRREAGDEATLLAAFAAAAARYADLDGRAYGLRNLIVRKNRGKWIDAARNGAEHGRAGVLARPGNVAAISEWRRRTDARE